MPTAISRECSPAAAASSSAQQEPVAPAMEPAMPHPRTRRQKREAAGDAGDFGSPQLVQGPDKRRRRSKAMDVELALYVRWHSPTNKTKVTRLSLRAVETVDVLQGISKNLVARAFPEHDRPDYLTSKHFSKFTPTEEFMTLPGDIARTEFRLVATYQGWEYTLLERELGAYRDSERRMLVTVIEFESTALMVGHLGLRMSLIAYPLVSLKSSFLDTVQQLLHSGQDVTGLLEEGMPSNTITDNQRTHFS